MNEHRHRALANTISAVICLVFLIFLTGWGQPELDAIMLINAERDQLGLQPLLLNVSLMHAAENHSQDMADYGFIGHTGSDGSTPWQRMKREGYTDWFAAGEVIVTAATAKAAVYHLLQSPEHSDILLKPVLNEVGVGFVHDPDSRYRYYWTMDLGGRHLCENCTIKIYLPILMRNSDV